METLTPAQLMQFAGVLMALGLQAAARLAEAEGLTVEAVLTRADANWQKGETEIEELLELGHKAE